MGNGEAGWSTADSGAPLAKFSMHPSLQAIFQTTGSAPNFQEMFIWGWGSSNSLLSAGGFTITSVNGKKMDFQPVVSTVGAPPTRGLHAVLTSFVPGVGVHDRKFYVFGGFGSGGLDGTHYLYNAATNTWSTIATP